jgi:uncharacterized membrane protein YbhN (UPF0104 family)
MRARLVVLGVLTLGCLALVLHGTDLGRTLDALRSFELWRVPVVATLFVLVHTARTLRFRRLLATPVPFAGAFWAMSASFFAINVLPLRLGELVRPYLFAQRGVPIAESAVAIVIERLLDVIALLALVLVATWVPGSGARDLLGLARHAALAGIVVLSLVLVLALALARWGRGPALALRVAEAVSALRTRSLADAVVIFACTLASWCLALAACGTAMAGFAALETDLATVLVDWAATVSAVTVAPTPGSVGSFEAGAIAGLVAEGRDADVARAFAATLHAIQLGP